MKKRVEELVSGTFEYKAPKLILSETAVSLKLQEGEAYRGEFFSRRRITAESKAC